MRSGTVGRVVAVCVSAKRRQRKRSVPEARLLRNYGVEDDAHAGEWHRQVSLLAQESIDKMRNMGLEVGPGDFAENITTEGMELHTLPIGTRLRVGEAVLEVTQVGKLCHERCAIFKRVGDCVMPREGIFAVVLEDGIVRPGDRVELLDGANPKAEETSG